jgi:putative MATE family efflux protein
MKTPLLGNRHFYLNTITLGLPVAVQNLLTTSASMVDTIMIGSQGELAVAAVGICAQFTMLLFAGYFGFCNGGTIFFAQYWGEHNDKGICRSYGITLCCMIFVGFLFGALAVFVPDFILRIYTNKESIRAAGVPYLRIVGFTYPLQTLIMAVSSLLRSTEKVKIPLFASVVSLLVNTFINWVLIYGMLGFPRLGVTGAAIGTVAAHVVHILVLYIYCFQDKHSHITRSRDHYRWTVSSVKQFFTRSAYVVYNEILYGTGMLLINIIIGRQVEAGIAAMAVFRVLEGLVFAFFGGLSNASAVMVGKQVGAGEHLAGYTDAKRFALLCPCLTLLICLVILMLRPALLGLFSLGDEALGYERIMLLIYTATGTIRTCNYISNNIFRAGGEVVFGTVVESCGLFLVSIPATAISGIVFNLPFPVVFAVTYLDEVLRLCLILWYLNSGKWIKPVTGRGREKLPAFRKMLAKDAVLSLK